ncbi:PadR family transcriptional regulator [Planotetraspora thailandica]|uniref:PadR family transcriptional regulator n=1 Tax=Planotetraspora thailandica TaxID=487172 RepID=UPI00195271ED|nr:PadR family transcriptional regulator [Planotetraspora thailandica]
MEPPALSFTEWLVLALVAEGPTHGFAIARLTAASGPVGAIWQVSKPLVYRAAGRLSELGLIHPAGTAPGDGGPDRNLIAATPAGLAAVNAWLLQPVKHIRDIRSELLVKLALLDRAGVSPRPLLDAQRDHLAPVVAGLERRLEEATGFDRTLASWRYETAQATMRFLQSVNP